jgi:hypothetical protein
VTLITSASITHQYEQEMSPGSSTTPLEPDWERVPDEQWNVYRRVIHEARTLGVRFAFGGAFATACYTGQLRNTKDFDFYILPTDIDAMKRAISSAGLQDYYERLPYDRSWIYRSSRGDTIVDAIWAMANHRASVDEHWVTHGPEIAIRGELLRAIPVEELIWSKLYILQRERCDWVDVFNLLDAQVGAVRWKHLLDRLGEDVPLLAGGLAVFGWLAPDRAGSIPPSVWSRVGLRQAPPFDGADLSLTRANLLDSRPWFTRHAR